MSNKSEWNTANAVPGDTAGPDLGIAERFVAARMAASPLPDFPGAIPASLADAYAVQSTAMSLWPDKVAGWKVGMIPVGFRERFAVDRLAGPMFERSVVRARSGDVLTMPVYAGGFAAIEAEFILELAQTVRADAGERYSDDELVALVKAAYTGAEVASSPLRAINDLGPCSIISDFGNNAGLIVGPEIPGWAERDPESLAVSVSIDGASVGSASAASIPGGPLAAMRFLLELSASRGLELPEGTLISSGAVTGVHEVSTESHSSIEFSEFGRFDVRFVAMEANR